MPYALIPDGYTLKKVTKLQKEAVNAHNRHENILKLLGNEKVPGLVAGGVLLFSAPTILRIIFDALNKQNGIDFDFQEGAVNYLTFTKDFGEALLDLSGPVVGTQFFEGEAQDFWDKYVKK